MVLMPRLGFLPSREVVLKELTNIDNGIGAPDLYLTLALLVAWLVIMLVLIKGIHSSGKASYFLALFPYVIMVVLLVRSVTLEGASTGIIYFFKPQWDRILEPKVCSRIGGMELIVELINKHFLPSPPPPPPQVWFAAVSQVFFSLAVCFGNIIMYSSFNKFRHNVHRWVGWVALNQIEFL